MATFDDAYAQFNVSLSPAGRVAHAAFEARIGQRLISVGNDWLAHHPVKNNMHGRMAVVTAMQQEVYALIAQEAVADVRFEVESDGRDGVHLANVHVLPPTAKVLLLADSVRARPHP